MTVTRTEEGCIVTRTFTRDVDGQFVEHVTLESPRNLTETARLRLVTARDLGRAWST